MNNAKIKNHFNLFLFKEICVDEDKYIIYLIYSLYTCVANYVYFLFLFNMRSNALKRQDYAIRTLIHLMIVVLLIFGCSKKSNGLNQQNVNLLIREFLKYHVAFDTFNDTLSERTLDNMIVHLDPGKYFFYKSDIDRLMVHKHLIDDYVAKSDYSFLAEIIDLYKKRYHEKIKLFEELVILDYDFSKDDTMILDRDKIDYVQNAKEDEERWKKNIKLQLLNYLTIVKDIKQAREKLKKKYTLALKKVDEFDNDGKKYAFFLNAFSMALDPHSNYLTREEHEDFMIQTNLKLEGIGVMLRSEDGFVMVEHVMPNGAADKLPEPLKLKPNDKIIAVAQGDGEPVDVVDMDLRDVVKMIRGPKGTEVRLTILRKVPDRKEPVRMVVPIIREVINLEDQAAKSEIITVGSGESAKKIGYIKLPSFYLDFDAAQRFDPNTRSSFRDMVTILTNLKNNVDAVVLDLRGNPGGALDEAINIAGLFIDRGPILQIKGLDRWGNRDSIKVLNDNYPGVLYAGPLVILVDKFSASAAEILAGAIRDYKRGIIIGPTNTFGKGTVQSYQKLLEGLLGAIKITTGIFYQPAGISNHLYGIQPHIIVPDLSAIWDIGEDKLKYPLKWERIPPANFTPEQKYVNTQILASLAMRSSERIKQSEKFRKLEEKIARLKSVVNSKVISLKKESESIDQEIKEIEQETRKSRKKDIVDLENDLFLQEAINITVDYVSMLAK